MGDQCPGRVRRGLRPADQSVERPRLATRGSTVYRGVRLGLPGQTNEEISDRAAPWAVPSLDPCTIRLPPAHLTTTRLAPKPAERGRSRHPRLPPISGSWSAEVLGSWLERLCW